MADATLTLCFSVILIQIVLPPHATLSEQKFPLALNGNFFLIKIVHAGVTESKLQWQQNAKAPNPDQIFAPFQSHFQCYWGEKISGQHYTFLLMHSLALIGQMWPWLETASQFDRHRMQLKLVYKLQLLQIII